jgi:hypothetical protein
MMLIALVTTAVVALGLLLNVLVERPLLRLFRGFGKQRANAA